MVVDIPDEFWDIVTAYKVMDGCSDYEALLMAGLLLREAAALAPNQRLAIVTLGDDGRVLKQDGYDCIDTSIKRRIARLNK